MIFLLGCDTSKESKGAISWVNTNIVNVAVTRAKYRLYIIGDIDAWKISFCVSTAKRIIDTFALSEIHKIEKSCLTIEEKEHALAEASINLPMVSAFSVQEVVDDNGEIDYSVDTETWIKGLNQDFMKYTLKQEQLSRFGFSSENEINRLSKNVRDNLKMGIRLYFLLSPVYKINNNIDASCCAILFCKAMELHIKEMLIKHFKQIIPDYEIKGEGPGRARIAIKDANENEFTLGAFVTIINQNKKTLAKAFAGKYDIQWWSSFEKKLKDCKDRRNNCCHSGIFNWTAQEWLRLDMFIDDSKLPKISRTPPIGGLIFELSDLGMERIC